MADLEVTITRPGEPGLVARFTDRRGGASAPPYDDANLALHVGDDPHAVLANRRALQDRVGAAIVWMEQVHAAEVAVVDTATDDVVRGVDALVATTPDLAVAVLVADCVPVVLRDRVADVVAVVHAGRRGLAAGVLPRTVEVMTRSGAREDRMVAVFGPAICGRCYEIPAAMRDEVEAAAPGSATTTSQGTPGIDLRGGLRRQLRSLGLADADIHDTGVCTAESPDHFSHRRDGVTGRFAGVARLRPAGSREPS